MRTLVRVTQYCLAVLLLHFSVTIIGQQKYKSEFFKADVQDNFDDIYIYTGHWSGDGASVSHITTF